MDEVMRIALLLALLSMIGCSKPSDDDWRADFRARRAAVADRPVPMPTTTPYDADVEKRAIYREWYWFGYKQGLSGIGATYCGTDHPMVDVQVEAYYAGQRDGAAEHQKGMSAR